MILLDACTVVTFTIAVAWLGWRLLRFAWQAITDRGEK